MSQQLVLVTGVSGFLGSHVLDRLLKEGYRVRGTVRSSKVAAHKEVYASYGRCHRRSHRRRFYFCSPSVSALIHVASPLIGRSDAESTLDGVVKGTTIILIQAQKAGVKHLIVTSSMAAVADISSPKETVTEEDWNPSTREEAIANAANPLFVYLTSKALAEREVWKVTDCDPTLHVTTLNPSFFMGPFAPGFILQPGAVGNLSTNLMIYNITLPDSKSITPLPGYTNVRDVARALVAAIRVEGKHRVLICGEWFQHEKAVEYLRTARPELKERLPANIGSTGQKKAVVDNARALRILGIPPVRTWKESLLETVDALVEVEKDWAAKGVDVDTILKKNSWREESQPL